MTYTGYDGDGDVTARVDGNGTTTAYTYADPESLLTNIHYTLPASPPPTSAPSPTPPTPMMSTGGGTR